MPHAICFKMLFAFWEHARKPIYSVAKPTAMMKAILSCLLAFLAFFTASAQEKKLNLNFGLEAGIPIGDFQARSNFGLGGTVKMLYSIGEKTALTLQTGALYFIGKTDTDDYYLITRKYDGLLQVPVKVGLKHAIAGKLYGEPQLGLALLSDEDEQVVKPIVAYNLGFAFSKKVELTSRLEYMHAGFDGLVYAGIRLVYSLR
jgi:hypothetical protein